jgi:excisionase family DNA binding protein
MKPSQLAKLYKIGRRSIVKELKKGNWGAVYLVGFRQSGWSANNPPTKLGVMTPYEIASILGLSDITVRDWCKSGKVKAFKIGDKWRIYMDDGLRIIRNRGCV